MRKLFSVFTFVLIGLIPALCQAEPLTIATWNLEWLTVNHSAPGTQGARRDQDFDALAQHFSTLNSDILAFQEVDSAAAIARIVGPDYRVILSDRAHPEYRQHQFSDVNQYTGFAIRQGVPFENPPDINLNGTPNHKLRFAAYIVLYPNSQHALHTLSVHLKAGCAGKFIASQASCQTLLSQGQALREWIKARQQKQQHYLILGDLNHNLAYSGDWFWQALTNEIRPSPELATRSTQAQCQVRSRNQPNKLHQFRSLIDHIIVSPGTSFQPPQQILFPRRQVLDYHLSDHCPIRAVLNR